MNTPVRAHEIPSLDGWRALAIGVVFLSHAGLGTWVPGGFGVTVFFFLSGFLITSLMLLEQQRTGTLNVQRFYIRRFLRLSPPLFITLALVYALTGAGLLQGSVTWRGLAAQLFYFANYYGIFFDTGNTLPAGTGIFWSLAVEEHYYLVFPWVFLLSYRGRKQPFAWVLGCACVGVLLWRTYLVAHLHVPEYRTYYASDTRIDSIIYGALLALIRNPVGELSAVSRLRSGLFISGAIAAIMFTFLYRNPDFRETFRYSIQGLALAPLFYYSIRLYRNRLFSVLNLPAVRYIGKCSYSIYLIHFVLIVNLQNLTRFAPFNMLVCFVLALVYATVIDRLVDERFRELRAKFR